jgi:hypothetical protein
MLTVSTLFETFALSHASQLKVTLLSSQHFNDTSDTIRQIAKLL